MVENITPTDVPHRLPGPRSSSWRATHNRRRLAGMALTLMAGCGAASGGEGSGGAFGSGGNLGSGGAGTGGAVGSGGAPCTSGKTWSMGDGPAMAPGYDCVSCHSFTIGGTIFPAAHDPNNCDGTSANGLKVVITGADGSVVTLTPNATSGNFYSTTPIKTPYSAMVTNSSGATRAMTAPQTTGGCNSCHTAIGANGAPGRIMAP